MRLRTACYQGIGFGIISGVGLGLLFKWIEYVQFANVYTLLLNVDFVPQIPQPLPEWIEFSLHLLVSVAIGIIFCLLNQWKFRPWLWGFLMGVAPIPLFIPLTLLSERTPAISDMAALGWWIVGHIVYGILLSILLLVSTKFRKAV